jgi:hypothetical protein
MPPLGALASSWVGRAAVLGILAFVATLTMSFDGNQALARSPAPTAQWVAENCRGWKDTDLYPNDKVYSQKEYARAYQQLVAQSRSLPPGSPDLYQLSQWMTVIRQCDEFRASRKVFKSALKDCSELEKALDYLDERVAPLVKEGVFGEVPGPGSRFLKELVKDLRPALANCLRESEEKCIDLNDPRRVKWAARLVRLGQLIQKSLPSSQRDNSELKRKIKICPKPTKRRCPVGFNDLQCQDYLNDARLILKEAINEKLWFDQ